ncbi:MAG: hypothetical protein MUF69_11940 [Desulfobacterota bacterium]|nr:hypothetical protein [Thermodesulfobacteriota bacterium]
MKVRLISTANLELGEAVRCYDHQMLGLGDRFYQEVSTRINAFPLAIQAKHEEVLQFIKLNRLRGKGLGYIDVPLSASAVLTGVPLWTHDLR